MPVISIRGCHDQIPHHQRAAIGSARLAFHGRSNYEWELRVYGVAGGDNAVSHDRIVARRIERLLEGEQHLGLVGGEADLMPIAQTGRIPSCPVPGAAGEVEHGRPRLIRSTGWLRGRCGGTTGGRYDRD